MVLVVDGFCRLSSVRIVLKNFVVGIAERFYQFYLADLRHE